MAAICPSTDQFCSYKYLTNYTIKILVWDLKFLSILEKQENYVMNGYKFTETYDLYIIFSLQVSFKDIPGISNI